MENKRGGFTLVEVMTAILLFYVLVYIVFTPKECLPF